jgi:glutathione S-transferase
MLRVLNRPGAGRPIRVIWALEEAGADYEVVWLDRDAMTEPEHLARQPLGRVPVLEQDGETIFESLAIMFHVADAFPEAGLLADKGTVDRGRAYQWGIFSMTEIEPPMIDAYRYREGNPDLGQAARKRLDAALAAVEAQAARGPYILGESFTIADVALGGVVETVGVAVVVMVGVGVTVEVGIGGTVAPALRAAISSGDKA